PRCDGSSRRRKDSWWRLHLCGESDSPEKRQRSAESDDAKRGHVFRCETAKMPALQNCGVKQPDAKGAHHLHIRQWLPHKKTAGQSKSVKRKAPPKQARDRREKIGQWRKMRENRVELMRLELPLLDEIHHASDTREREGPISHQ